MTMILEIEKNARIFFVIFMMVVQRKNQDIHEILEELPLNHQRNSKNLV